MARRSVYDKLLPFNSSYGFISDVDMWMRVCFDYDIAYVRQPLILLDHSPTQTRGWVWKHKDAVRRMQIAHLEKRYGANPKQLNNHMRRHRFEARRVLLRGVFGAVTRLDIKQLREGFPLWNEFLDSR